MGVVNLLVYDHVLGADPDRPGGFRGAYDKDVAFHEPLTFFAYAAAVTTSLELVSCVMILPQRQTVLVAKQAAEVAVLSGNRLRLGIGTGWNVVEYVGLNESFTDRGRRQAEQVEVMRRLWSEPSFELSGDVPHHRPGGHQPAPVRADPDLVRRRRRRGDRALRPTRRRLDPARYPERLVARAHRADPRDPRLARRVRHPGPGAVRRRRPRPLAHARRAVARPRCDAPRDRHPQRRADRRRRPPGARGRVPCRRPGLTPHLGGIRTWADPSRLPGRSPPGDDPRPDGGAVPGRVAFPGHGWPGCRSVGSR